MVVPAYRMHTQSFLNVLDEISEKDALIRVNGQTNHMVWMAGNFVNARYEMGRVLGLKEEDPFGELFFQAKKLDESFSYPTLEVLKGNLHKISPLVYQKLLKITDEELATIFPIGMDIPYVEENVLNYVGMSLGRADYLCGQMGLMRRILGYSGMKYDVDNSLKY